MGSPSYLDKIAWREGKPQHYSEPKLILDLSHWKRNTGRLPVPAEPIGGSIEDLGEVKVEEVEEVEEEETGDLFQEITRWVESAHSRLHSPSTSPSIELCSPSCYTSSPPLPLSHTDLQTPVFHYNEHIYPPSADDEDRRSPIPPITSSSNSLPFIFPSSPTAIFSPQKASPPPTPLGQLPESQPLSSTSSVSQSPNADSTESVPVKQKERLFDLDVFISRALKLVRQNKEKVHVKKGKDESWMEESKTANIKGKVPRLSEHRTSPSQTPKS